MCVSEYLHTFKNAMAAVILVCLLATGYRARGEIYSLLMPIHPFWGLIPSRNWKERQAPFEITGHSSKSVKEISQVVSHNDIGLFLRKLDTPGVGADNGIHQEWQ